MTTVTRVISGLLLLYNTAQLHRYGFQAGFEFAARCGGLIAAFFLWQRAMKLSNLHSQISHAEHMIFIGELGFQEEDIAPLATEFRTEWLDVKWW